MIRRRLLWFTLGFSSTSVAIGQFVFKDLWTDRNSMSSQLMEKFNSLDTRVSNLEAAISNKTFPTQACNAGEILRREPSLEHFLRIMLPFLLFPLRMKRILDEGLQLMRWSYRSPVVSV